MTDYGHVRRDSVTCPRCQGAGGAIDPVTDDGRGPWFVCDQCEGIGLVQDGLADLRSNLRLLNLLWHVTGGQPVPAQPVTHRKGCP